MSEASDQGVPADGPTLTYVRLYNDDEGVSRAPTRQCVLVLAGILEVTAGEETRRFGPGDPVLAEDTAGPGHTTTAVEDAIFGVVRL